MNEIMKADAFLQKVGDSTSISDVKRFLAELEAVKAALCAADRFRTESVKYAMYEAYALIRAFEISGDAHLIKGKYRKLAAEWLAGLSESERAEYIAMCENGKTIDNVYKSMIYTPAQRDALANAVNICKTEARNQLRDTGAVSIHSIIKKHQNRFPRSMVKDITDGVRDAVRRAGGVGLGDGNSTYVNPDKDSRYVSDAIATRIEAVARDIESIADLAERAESKPTFRIKGDGNELGFIDITCIILAGVGCAKLQFDSYDAKKNSCSIIRQIVGDVE
jgi:hypothetical protein